MSYLITTPDNKSHIMPNELSAKFYGPTNQWACGVEIKVFGSNIFASGEANDWKTALDLAMAGIRAQGWKEEVDPRIITCIPTHDIEKGSYVLIYDVVGHKFCRKAKDGPEYYEYQGQRGVTLEEGLEKQATKVQLFDRKTLIPPDPSPAQSHLISEIITERAWQDSKWGEQNHADEIWYAILAEEMGEVAQALLHTRFGGEEAGHVKEELIQVAAVALGWLECINRRGK